MNFSDKDVSKIHSKEEYTMPQNIDETNQIINDLDDQTGEG